MEPAEGGTGRCGWSDRKQPLSIAGLTTSLDRSGLTGVGRYEKRRQASALQSYSPKASIGFSIELSIMIALWPL